MPRLTLPGRFASRGPAPWALGALAAAQVAYGLGSRPPKATRAIVALMLGTSALEARRAGEGRAVAAAGAVGFAAELVGVATGKPFGHYSYSSRLGPRVGGVPLLAAAAWAMMARPAWVTAGRLSARRSHRIVLAAGALTAWDVFLDPRMAREGYWSWPGGGRYEGVPASNFAGWFLTGLAVFAAYAALAREGGASSALARDNETGPARGGEVRARGASGGVSRDNDAARALGGEVRARGASAAVARGDDAALALYVWTWLGELFANAALWNRPRVAVAGGVAMGAFALPALWRR